MKFRKVNLMKAIVSTPKHRKYAIIAGFKEWCVDAPHEYVEKINEFARNYMDAIVASTTFAPEEWCEEEASWHSPNWYKTQDALATVSSYKKLKKHMREICTSYTA